MATYLPFWLLSEQCLATSGLKNLATLVSNAEEVAASKELVSSEYNLFFFQMFLICTIKNLTVYSLCGYWVIAIDLVVFYFHGSRNALSWGVTLSQSNRHD